MVRVAHHLIFSSYCQTCPTPTHKCRVSCRVRVLANDDHLIGRVPAYCVSADHNDAAHMCDIFTIRVNPKDLRQIEADLANRLEI